MKSPKRGIAYLLILPVLLLGCPVDAAAAPALEEAPAPTSDAAVSATAKLLSAGLTPEEAAARVAAMSPAEVAHAAQSDVEIRRGGDGVVVLLLVIFFAILVFSLIHHHHAHD